jgi:hypothetical protein
MRWTKLASIRISNIEVPKEIIDIEAEIAETIEEEKNLAVKKQNV